MICNKCGAENPDYYVFCQNCFADLSKDNVDVSSTDEYSQQQDSGSSFEDAYSDGLVSDDAAVNPPQPYAGGYGNDAPAYAPPAAQEYIPPTGRIRQNASHAAPPAPTDDTSQRANLTNSVAEGVPPSELRKAKRQTSRDARELEKLQNNQGAEYYDYYDYYDEAALKREKTRTRKTGLILGIIIAVLIIGAATAGIVFAISNYGSLPGAVEAIFMGRQPVVVEIGMSERGKPCHKLIIRAKKGETLRFTNLPTPQEVKLESSEAASYTIEDDQWIPIDPDPNQATIEVQPIVMRVDKNGNETQLEVQPYTIDVPQATLVITEPAVHEGNVTDQSLLPIMGQAQSGNDNDVTVSFNGQDLGTDVLQPDGSFAFSAQLADSAYELTFTAKANRCRPVTVVLTGQYSGSIDPFVIDESVPLRSADSIVNVTGRGPIGQPSDTMTVSGGSAGDITYDPTSGTFSFAVRLTQPVNTFTMKVGDRQQKLTIYQVPEVNAYANRASELNFSAVSAAPSEAFNKVYYFKGTIESILRNEEPYQFIVNVDGDKSKRIEITYYGLDTPVVGTEFLYYATSTGKSTNDTSMLSMECYFMYSTADIAAVQQQNAAAAPAADESPES